MENKNDKYYYNQQEELAHLYANMKSDMRLSDFFDINSNNDEYDILIEY
jgi:hypothetical protein